MRCVAGGCGGYNPADIGPLWTLGDGPTVEVDSVRCRGGPELGIESRPVDMEALVESNAPPENDGSLAEGMNPLDMGCCIGGGADITAGVLVGGRGRML